MQSSSVDERVLRPLQMLVDMFQGPLRLCQKRSDKLMDYTAALHKLKQNKDGNKRMAVSIVNTLHFLFHLFLLIEFFLDCYKVQSLLQSTQSKLFNDLKMKVYSVFSSSSTWL